MDNKKVCIIGAGSSGLTVAKAFHEANIPFDCYEIGSKIGGNWLYNNDNNISSAYWSLHINTSKSLMEYSDFPMPDDYPEYPNHTKIYEYFENYVDHFGFRDKIIFNTKVEKVEKLDDNRYLVHTNRFESREYSDIVVANGHHWSPKYPDFKGEFSGKTMHSHYYKTIDGFEEKRILIVGIGNSAVDIACELSTVSRDVTISTRSGAYIMPKYMFGRPTDHLTKPPLAYLPLFIQRPILRIALWLNVGNQENYGVPKPKRKILKEHPTLSQELLTKVGHGKINIKSNIQRLNGNTIHFEDDTTSDFDTIIYCTGYKVDFPFFDDDTVSVKNNEMPLYEYVVDPDNKGLYFVGLIQPIGAVMPLVELQGVWIANIIQNKVQLPTVSKMKESIKKRRDKMRKRYGDSTRHTFEVDFYPYKRRLKKLINY